MIQPIEAINKQYNGNWVFLINCEIEENGDLIQGEVICHSKSREEVFRKMHEYKNSDTMFSIRFAGEIPEGVNVVLWVNIHDKSYKALFSNKEIFLNLINEFTENEWKKELTADSLSLVNKSFILADYEEVEADIIYQAEVGGQKIIFYVLLEFQSSVDYSMPIRVLMYMIEIWREVLKGVNNEEIKRKDFKLPAIVPIVTYNGKGAWNVPRNFKEKIAKYELFGEKLLDFEYVLLDVNRYDKAELLAKESISSAIFLLDQKVDYKEYMERLATIVKAFNKLTDEEKLELKKWLANTLSEEIKDAALSILDADKEDVDKMTANITRTIEEMKEEARLAGELKGKLQAAKSLLDILDDETIADRIGLPLEKVKALREE